MFTGIISDIGRIEAVTERPDGRVLDVAVDFDTDDVEIGASINHSGICLTVTEKAPTGYRIFASPETLERTTAGGWTQGTRLNIERSLTLGQELGGHLVFGHVDDVGEILLIEQPGDSRRFEIAIPSHLAPLIAVKGSIAVDGISLTINEATHDRFAVMIIPHTLEATTLADRHAGDRVNIEVDMLARYVARQLAFAGPLPFPGAGQTRGEWS